MHVFKLLYFLEVWEAYLEACKGFLSHVLR